jgi:hypothetical protein
MYRRRGCDQPQVRGPVAMTEAAFLAHTKPLVRLHRRTTVEPPSNHARRTNRTTPNHRRTGAEPRRTSSWMPAPNLFSVSLRHGKKFGGAAGGARCVRCASHQGATGRGNTCRLSHQPAFSTRRGIGGLRPRPWPAQEPMVGQTRTSTKSGFAMPGGLALPGRFSEPCMIGPRA